MVSQADFPYWHPKAVEASLSEECSCAICGANPALDETNIADFEHEGAICLECLASGKISSKVGDEASDRDDSFQATQEQVSILNRHPRIFANHQSQWPVCCDDFMYYHGYPSMHDEIRAAFFNERAEGGDGARLFREAFRSDWTTDDDADYFWSPTDEWDSVIFEVHVFECRKCGRIQIVYEPD